MNLVKTSALSALSVLTRILTAVVLNKVLAVYVGPSGYGVIGQFQNLVGIASTLASGGVNTGVTKYTAEYANDADRQRSVWSTASGVGLVGAGLGAVFLVLAREPLARWTLGDASHSGVFIWLAISLALLVLNGLMLAVLNGRKAVRGFVLAGVAGNLLSAALAGTLIVTHGLSGALHAVAVSQGIACLLTAAVFRRSTGLGLSALFGRVDPDMARRLGHYALMAAASALAIPLAQMFIRDRLAQDLGWTTVGLWQALWKISELHLMLLTTTLSVYLLPRLSEIQDPDELAREVRAGYRFVVPLSLASATLIYAVREPLVHGLLSAEFLPVLGVLGVQLVGDWLKINSWVMAYTMVSHAQTRSFIVTELGFSLVLALGTVAMARQWGLAGAATAYALTYAGYWGVITLVYRRLLNGMPRNAKPTP